MVSAMLWMSPVFLKTPTHTPTHLTKKIFFHRVSQLSSLSPSQKVASPWNNTRKLSRVKTTIIIKKSINGKTQIKITHSRAIPWTKHFSISKNENDVQKSEERILWFYIFCRSKKGRRKDEKVKRKRTNAKTKQEENL